MESNWRWAKGDCCSRHCFHRPDSTRIACLRNGPPTALASLGLTFGNCPHEDLPTKEQNKHYHHDYKCINYKYVLNHFQVQQYYSIRVPVERCETELVQKVKCYYTSHKYEMSTLHKSFSKHTQRKSID